MRNSLLMLFVLLSLHAISADHVPKSKLLKQRPESIHIIYDSTELRVPGSCFAVGLEMFFEDATSKKTKNLGGKIGLRNFKFEVSGGKYRAGKITIDQENHSGEILITVYPRKFPDQISEQRIPGHYERNILFRDVPNGAAPGDRFEIVLNAIFNNGDSILVGTKDFPYTNYDIEVVGGVFSNGIVAISEDIHDIKNHEVYIKIAPKSTSGLAIERYYPLDYIKDYHFQAAGDFGSSGFSGDSGSDGSTIGNYIGGEFGEHGEHGNDGERGPDIDLYASVHYDELLNEPMLLVELIWDNKSKHYLIHPEEGSLKVVTAGGSGGSGGRGGNGGNGSAGITGEVRTFVEWINDSTSIEVQEQLPGGDGGYGGGAGHGGNGGYGGDGGDIFVYYTKDAYQYLDLLLLESKGGLGGSSGFGGFGGSGGIGGSGNPTGRNGEGGDSGKSGDSGDRGRDGEIVFLEWKTAN